MANPKRKLLDQVQEVLRVKHYFLRTGETGVQRIRRHLIYCRDHSGLAWWIVDAGREDISAPGGEHLARRDVRRWRHPKECGPFEVAAFLSHLADAQGVSAGSKIKP